MGGSGISERTSASVRRPNAWPRNLLITAVYLIGWAGLVAAAASFEVRPGVSVWFPPAALDVVLLLVCGLRWWPLTVVNLPLYVLAFGSDIGFRGLDLLIYAVVTTAAYAGAVAVLARVRIDPGLIGLRDTVWFVAVACCGGPMMAALLQVTNLVAFGHLPPADAPVAVLQFWAGDATGIGMLAPFLLVLLRRWPGLWARPPTVVPALALHWPKGRSLPRHAAEVLAFAAGLWLAFGAERATDLDYTYFVWLPLTWVALRHGFARTTLVVLLVNLAVALMVKAQLGAISSLALQFGLMTLTLSSLLLGAVSSEVQRGAARLRHQVLHDALTELPNRLLFGDRLEQAMRRARRQRAASFAVLFLDLDRFKGVNDGLGHAAGDRLLQEVGRRLAAQTRATDTVARLGGDEFAVLADGAADAADALRFADRLLQAFAAPFDLGGGEVRVFASVGVAVHDGVKPPEQMLRDADAALHAAKARGAGHAVLFDAAMHAQALDRLELEADLMRALEAPERGGLALHYQPLVALDDGAMVGAEALARWRHPERGWVPPDVFIPIAEDSGLIQPLGRWALRAACAQARAWRDDGRRLRLAVNVSTRELQRPGYAEEIVATIVAAGLAPGALELELTESVLLERSPQVTGALARLAAVGIPLSIDDFGTGYASLGYLKDLPVRGLKLDRAFVRDVPGDPGSEAIVEGVLALSKRLRLGVIAEGVETEEQARFLRARGCLWAQGFLFGRPVPAAELRPDAPPRVIG